MSGSSSGSDSGGKSKSPNTKKKKERGRKLDLASLLQEKNEPTEEAIKGPIEKASSCKGVSAAAAEAAKAADIAAAPTAAAKSTAVTVETSATAAVKTSSRKAVAAVPRNEVVSTNKAPAAPKVAEVITKAITSAANTSNKEAPETSKFPKLIEVVKEASKSAPPALKTIMRPPLSIEKKKNAATSETPSPAVVSGISYAQQVSGNSKKNSSVIEIIATPVTPRSPPLDAGKPRSTSDVDLQKRFDERWQDDRYGMHFDHIRGSAQSAYLEAICAVIPQEQLFSFGLVGKGMVEVYTATLDAATKLMLSGIEVNGRHLQPYPLSVKPTRVVISQVPLNVQHADIVKFFNRFGKVHGKPRSIPIKIGEKGLGRGVYSTSREVFVTLNQGCVLPTGFVLSILGVKRWITITTEAKCHACHQAGHFIAECPKRNRKVAEAASQERTTSVVNSQEASSPGAAPVLEEHPANQVTEGHENKLPEEKSGPAIQDITSSSDEESPKKTLGKKKRTKRKPKTSDGEVMPPPAPVGDKAPAKRRLSDDDSQRRSSKVPAITQIVVVGGTSEGEAMTVDEDDGPPLSESQLQSGYESCGSSLSICSGFERTRELQGISKEKMRSLLENLNYRKSEEKIWSILKSELEDPRSILPQLKLLQKDARAKKKYNEVSRCERLYAKISSIIEEKTLDGSLRP